VRPDSARPAERIRKALTVDPLLIAAAGFRKEHSVARAIRDVEDRCPAVLSKGAFASFAGPRDGHQWILECDLRAGRILDGLHLGDRRIIRGPSGDIHVAAGGIDGPAEYVRR